MFVDWLIIFVATIGSFLLTPVIRCYAVRKNLLDLPNERTSHELPTPRGGGLAIVITFFAGLTVLAFLYILPSSFISALMGAGIIVATVGFLDDHFGISPSWRIIVHFVAAVWIVLSLNGFFMNHGLLLSGLFLNLFWIVSIVWLINLYNFMDGIDAIAGVEAVFVCISGTTLFLISGDYSMASVSALLAAAVAGFLFWNLPPAKIFMGDVGSGLIGVIIGVIALAGIKGEVTSVWVWVILLGVFLVDATMTVGRRMMRGAKCYSAHRSHAYQHAAQTLKSHGKVTLAITIINIFWLFPWAFIAWKWREFGLIFTVIALAPLISLAFYYGAGLEEVKFKKDQQRQYDTFSNQKQKVFTKKM